MRRLSSHLMPLSCVARAELHPLADYEDIGLVKKAGVYAD